MRKPHVLIFYSHHKERQLCEGLEEKFSLRFFPLGAEPNAEPYNEQASLALIFDSSKEEEGLATMERIKSAFPRLPLILAVKEPSKKYLLAALKYKVADFLIFPVDKAGLLRTASQAFRDSKKPGLAEKAKNWLADFHHGAHSMLARLASSLSCPERQEALQEEKAFSHPYLHFPNKLEPEGSYDMNVQFFGNLSIRAGERPTPRIKGKKNATVLAYLLFHHHRPTHKDILMDRFWRNYATSSARNSLNVAICHIRKSLSKTFHKQEIIVYHRESYGINPELKVITDTEKFIHYWKRGSAIESSQGMAQALKTYNTALGYYKQEFLSDIRFDSWCDHERDNLKEIYLYILNRLGTHLFDEKQFEACININKKMLKEDSCLEEIHRKQMACYYKVGLADLALRQYIRCKKALEKELNLEPSLPTVELFKGIQAGKLIQV